MDTNEQYSKLPLFGKGFSGIDFLLPPYGGGSGRGFFFFIPILFFIPIFCLLLLFFAPQVGCAQTCYTITGGGGLFKATGGGLGVAATGLNIQEAIEAIGNDAGGADCEIRFDGGGSVLDIGTATVCFHNGDGGTWGKITLSGKITSASFGATVHIGVDSAQSKALIINTAAACDAAILYTGNGLLEISGGEVTAEAGCAVYNRGGGTIAISGGTVEVTGAYHIAVYNLSGGTIHICSGGTVVASYLCGTAVYNNAGGTIFISGGEVKATATGGTAVYNNAGGTIFISGGKVKATATGGTAVYNNDPDGTIHISGGEVKATATSGTAVYDRSKVLSNKKKYIF